MHSRIAAPYVSKMSASKNFGRKAHSLPRFWSNIIATIVCYGTTLLALKKYPRQIVMTILCFGTATLTMKLAFDYHTRNSAMWMVAGALFVAGGYRFFMAVKVVEYRRYSWRTACLLVMALAMSFSQISTLNFWETNVFWSIVGLSIATVVTGAFWLDNRLIRSQLKNRRFRAAHGIAEE